MQMWNTLCKAGIAVTALFAASPSGAQVSELLQFSTVPHHADSGVRHGDPGPVDDAEGVRLTTKYATTVHVQGVNMMRIHFGAFDLGRFSEIRLTSLDDGASQRFTHEMLIAWNGWSAIFNGDTVAVELLVAPDEEAWFEITEIAINDPWIVAADGPEAFTLCGVDNRIASSDPRVGRLSGPNCGNGGGWGGCTAWLTSLGCALTAGHCGMAANGLIEFNVPPSESDGTPNAADPADQYPVGDTFYAFGNAGQGFDWAVMSVGPNANTGLNAFAVQGYFHLSPVLPSNGTTLRLTGFGVDNSPTGSIPGDCCASDSNGNCTHAGCNASSLTLQTATGAKSGDTIVQIFYTVDTEPANSGSPIIRESNQFAVGIHTHGGCALISGSSAGTRIDQPTLLASLNDFLDGAIFVDFANVSATQNGQALTPLRTVPQGVSLAPSGGAIAMAGGSYSAATGNTGVFSKAVTMIAVSGPVTIGN